MSKAKAIDYMAVLLKLRDEVEFGAEVAAGGGGIGCYGDGSTVAIDGVVFRSEPKIVEHFRQRPPGGDFFIDAHPEVLNVLPAKLVREVHLVVSGRINLVVSSPGVAVWVLVARCVVVLNKRSGLGARLLESVARVPMPGPGVNRRMPPRTGLLVHFDVVVDILKQRSCQTSASRDLAEMAEASVLRQVHTAGSDSPQKIG